MKLHPYKGRTIELAQEVEVYRNLNNGMWSIRDSKTKQILAHATAVLLHSPTFHVQPAGRDRVRRERRKNVHAYVKGRYIPPTLTPPTDYDALFKETTYDPYNDDYFMADGLPLYQATLARFTENKKLEVIEL